MKKNRWLMPMKQHKRKLMRIHWLYVLLLLPFLWVACKKYPEDKAEVSGFVLDGTTGKVIPNAKVILISQGNSFAIGGGYKTVERYTADSNGYYSFSFTGDQSLSYFVNAYDENYRDNLPASIKTIILGKKQTLDVLLTPKAWLKLHIKNVNPVNYNDTLRLYFYGSRTFVGTNIDTIHMDVVDGNQNFEISYSVIKNSIKTSEKETLFIAPFDTTLFDINY